MYPLRVCVLQSCQKKIFSRILIVCKYLIRRVLYSIVLCMIYLHVYFKYRKKKQVTEFFLVGHFRAFFELVLIRITHCEQTTLLKTTG